jgi:tetratricopeptide (TPR) repeat protein
MFYAPARGMSEARDRAPLMPALLLAMLTQTGYVLFTERLLGGLFSLRLLSLPFRSLLFIALVFIPLTILMANLFDRRGSFRLVLQQEYPSFASTVFYAWAAANVVAIPLAYLSARGGMLAAYVASSLEGAKQIQEWMQLPPEQVVEMSNPRLHARNFFWLIMLLLFWLWAVVAVRTVFRFTLMRTLAVMVISSVVVYFAALILLPLFGWIAASPFLLLLLFFFLRGYIGEVASGHRARASFKQNLEAATLNPADASAHYNLGLIHQQRGELDEARQRFERAIEIDEEELDAHYQLGRIARQQNLWADAIKHFEPVVARDAAHAQHEVWREIGATYLAAGQFEDAHDALERFLAQRQSDPEGLYLMGRAHAGLGHQREAAASMQACIEAVKTAPAYKYRTDKRWLNEAQEFIKSSQ